MAERRNDIGGKITYAIIAILLSMFFNKTYNIAESAYNLSRGNEKNIAVLAQCIRDIDRRLVGIDVKIDKLLASGK